MVGGQFLAPGDRLFVLLFGFIRVGHEPLADIPAVILPRDRPPGIAAQMTRAFSFEFPCLAVDPLPQPLFDRCHSRRLR